MLHRITACSLLVCALVVAHAGGAAVSTQACDCFAGTVQSLSPCACTCTAPWLQPRCSFQASQSVQVRFWVSTDKYPSDTFLTSIRTNAASQAITFAGKSNSTATASATVNGVPQFAYVVLAPGSIVPSLFAAVTAASPPAWVAANYITGIELVYGTRASTYDNGVIAYSGGGFLVFYVNGFIYIGVCICLCCALWCSECFCRSYPADRCKAEFESDRLVEKEMKYQDDLLAQQAAAAQTAVEQVTEVVHQAADTTVVVVGQVVNGAAAAGAAVVEKVGAAATAAQEKADQVATVAQQKAAQVATAAQHAATAMVDTLPGAVVSIEGEDTATKPKEDVPAAQQRPPPSA